MLIVEEIEGGLRAVDAAKNEVEVEIDEWEPGGEEIEIGYDVTETVTGSGTEIRLPIAGFLVESSALPETRILNMNERISIPTGTHLFRLSGNIDVFVSLRDARAAVVEKTKKISLFRSLRPRAFRLDSRPLKNFREVRFASQLRLRGLLPRLTHARRNTTLKRRIVRSLVNDPLCRSSSWERTRK